MTLTDDVTKNTETLKLATGKPAGADACIDFSPRAAGSAVIKASVGALRPSGRCAVMGGAQTALDIPYQQIMFNSIRIQGGFMYRRPHIARMIEMVESGLLRLGEQIGVRPQEGYGLDNIYDALRAAKESSGWGTQVVLQP